MPTDGSGNYSKPAGSTAVTGETIAASTHNMPVDDIAAALTARLMRNGAGGMTGNLPMNNNSITGADDVESDTFTVNESVDFAAAVNVASATECEIGSGASNFVNITGTTTIEGFDTADVGVVRFAKFAGSLTLTHDATSLILPGGANITTAAGDTAVFVSEGSGNWRCYSYIRASGQPLAAVTAANLATDAVETAKIKDAAVTLDKLADDARYVQRGYLFGLTLSNAADAEHDITVAAGESASADTSPVVLQLSSAITKRIDASWSVGTGNGGLDGSESVTGTPDADTWYHVWLIKRSDTGVTDVLFSESASSPTMPQDYDLKRRIGAVRTNGSANIRAFKQYGDDFDWVTPVVDVDEASSMGTSAVSRTLTVPPGTKAHIEASFFGNSSVQALISSLDQTDQTPALSLATDAGLYNSGVGYAADTQLLSVRANASSQIRTRHTASGAAVKLTIRTLGYTDMRGRLA